MKIPDFLQGFAFMVDINPRWMTFFPSNFSSVHGLSRVLGENKLGRTIKRVPGCFPSSRVATIGAV
jgi:hypothetical protein